MSEDQEITSTETPYINKMVVSLPAPSDLLNNYSSWIKSKKGVDMSPERKLNELFFDKNDKHSYSNNFPFIKEPPITFAAINPNGETIVNVGFFKKENGQIKEHFFEVLVSSCSIETLLDPNLQKKFDCLDIVVIFFDISKPKQFHEFSKIVEEYKKYIDTSNDLLVLTPPEDKCFYLKSFSNPDIYQPFECMNVKTEYYWNKTGKQFIELGLWGFRNYSESKYSIEKKFIEIFEDK